MWARSMCGMIYDLVLVIDLFIVGELVCKVICYLSKYL